MWVVYKLDNSFLRIACIFTRTTVSKSTTQNMYMLVDEAKTCKIVEERLPFWGFFRQYSIWKKTRFSTSENNITTSL